MIVGIIGCGTIANSAHIPSYMNNKEVTIKYFCDIIEERAQAAVCQRVLLRVLEAVRPL